MGGAAAPLPSTLTVILSRKTAEALDRQKRAELRSLSEREALAAADQLLAMAANAHYPAEKERSHGLVECQRILYGSGK